MMFLHILFQIWQDSVYAKRPTRQGSASFSFYRNMKLFFRAGFDIVEIPASAYTAFLGCLQRERVY